MPTLSTILPTLELPSIATCLGWVGMVLLLYAYARRKELSPTNYALFNLVGAVWIGISALEQRAWPPLALETAWAGIAVRDLWKVRKTPE